MTEPEVRLVVAMTLVAGLLGAGTCSQTPSSPWPDANNDGIVNILDVTLVAGCDGVDPSIDPACTAADVDSDGDVDSADLDLVIASFGNRLRITGELRAAGEPFRSPFALVEETVLGSFEMTSAGSGDLRTTPGTVVLETPGGGTLTATALHVNQPRRVDPFSGRPLAADAPADATCPTGGEPDCWAPGQSPPWSQNALEAVCAARVGFWPIFPDDCPLTIFNSQNLSVGPFLPDGSPNPGWVGVEPRVMIALTNIISGFPATGPTVLAGLGNFTATTLAAIAEATGGGITVLVPLVRDGDQDGDYLQASQIHADLLSVQPNSILFWTFGGLQRWLTDEQEALLGCGPFYGTLCDLDGINIARSEARAVLYSWPDGSVPPPGTEGSLRGQLCPRVTGGTWHVLPGCRGPRDPGYDVSVDGSTFGPDGFPADNQRVHPFIGQEWVSEMAIVSWNALMLGVIISPEFRPDHPVRTDACSFVNPRACSFVDDIRSDTARTLDDDPSGAPQLRWLWETGAEYQVSEASGDLAPFLDWTLHAFGPEQPRVDGATMGVGFLLEPPEGTTEVPASPLVVRFPGNDGFVGTPDDPFQGIAYGVSNGP